MSRKSVPQPPPVYRPQISRLMVQADARSTSSRLQPPPVYRPQQVGASAQPVAANRIVPGHSLLHSPPVYRPQPMGLPAQPAIKKTSLQGQLPLPAPPVYRPQQVLPVGQPVLKDLTGCGTPLLPGHGPRQTQSNRAVGNSSHLGVTQYTERHRQMPRPRAASHIQLAPVQLAYRLPTATLQLYRSDRHKPSLSVLQPRNRISVIQRIQWDTIKSSAKLSELLNGWYWQHYQVQTDKGNWIEVSKATTKYGSEESSSSSARRFAPEPPTYNCHGLTFGGSTATGGPYSFLSGAAVNQILADEFVSTDTPRVGDIVVFGNGDHSGVITSIDGGNDSLEKRIRVRSKLGTLAKTTEETVEALNKRFGTPGYYKTADWWTPLGLRPLSEEEATLMEIESRAQSIKQIEQDVQEILEMQKILSELI